MTLNLRLVPAIDRAILETPSMGRLPSSGEWPEFTWMGNLMTFEGVRVANREELETSLMERRDALRTASPQNKAYVLRDIAGYERLSKVNSVYAVKYLSTPEQSTSTFDRMSLGLEFYIDLDGGFSMISALPIRPR